jgi:hypothetical protein
MNLPHPWGAYMRLQSELDSTTQVNGRAWGLESGLDAMLASITKGTVGAQAEEPLTTISTVQRRERHRARLLRTYQSELRPSVDQPENVEARVELAQLRRRLATSDWQLVTSLAMGMDYQSIAENIGATPGSLRIRVLRIREANLRLAA